MKMNSTKSSERKASNRILTSFESFCYKFRYIFAILYVVLVFLTPYMGISLVNVQLLMLIGLYAVLGMGLNVLIGYTGQVSLGHAGFYAIGAYTCALLMTRLGVNFWPALLIAGAFTAFIGFLLGLPSLRLSGSYLSIVTLGFCEIVNMILKQWEQVTNGNYGVRGIPKPSIFGYELTMFNGGLLIFVLLLMGITGVACLAMRNSNTGRAWRAIKDDELAAGMMGIHTSRYKIMSFVVSAFITGIAGGFYCITRDYIEPNNFVFNTSILILSVVIVGGLGTVRGMIFGAALLQLFPQWFRFLNEWRFVVYGLLLVLMMLFRPQGALGWRSTQPFHLSKAAKKLMAAKGEPEDPAPAPTVSE